MEAQFTAILACYRSGQVSEAQWTDHLLDEEFAAWVERHDLAMSLYS